MKVGVNDVMESELCGGRDFVRSVGCHLYIWIYIHASMW